MEILTPFQKQILAALGNSALSSSFYLTGGTALSAYYLHHRFSEDLDFFAAAQEALMGVTTITTNIARQLSVEVEFTRTFPTFVECFFTNSAGDSVKVDFAYDTPFRLQPTTLDAQFGIQVDSLTDVACNKLSALFGRSESKDFVDVYFICREVMPFTELYRQAQEKHLGMTNYWLAMAMQNIQKVQILPRMIKPVEIADLQTFFLNLARELMSNIDPPNEFGG